MKSCNGHDRDMDNFTKKVAYVLISILAAQGIAGVIAGVQLATTSEQHTELIKENSKVLTDDNRAIIEIKTQQTVIKEDVKELKDDVKNIERLVQDILREVRKP